MGDLIELHKEFNEQRREPGEWDKAKNSLAIIACDERGNGCVLWHVGFHISNEIQEIGLSSLVDLGLDDAPHRISVWEGKYSYFGDGDDTEARPQGIFRNPTFEEWAATIAGVNPWKEEEWRIK
jgi:hypothetical protein